MCGSYCIGQCRYREFLSSQKIMLGMLAAIYFYFIFIFYFFETEFCSCCPGWSAMAWSQLIHNLCFLSSSNSPVSASQVAGITSRCHHTWLNFVFFVEMGFHRVGQTGLKLLTSGDPPALASQRAGITGLSHCAWPQNNLIFTYLYIWFSQSLIKYRSFLR